ncbi:flagellar motor switch protein [Ligilactobacillus acidipiscis]|uniref:flagellar motor switch protein n=1 Tax=Ligilactobacillus acidipiscis TaxID=89059 RepID=UPI0022DF49D4|nr:flagellar motor switch protein [Ligilactobacillus acidipiscis]
MNERAFQAKLKLFIKILKREQKFLVLDDGESLNGIVPQKEDFLPIFDKYTGEIGDKTKMLIQEIQELQETNLLLTQQALAYQKKMMDTIQHSLEKQENTYVDKHRTQSQPKREDIPAAIVDQSF